MAGDARQPRQPTAIAARPIGTLTKKTQRQLAATSRPPTTGPSAAASPPTAVQPRTAPWRRSGEVVASTRPSEVGVSSAAPAAWTIRKATSIADAGRRPAGRRGEGEDRDAEQEAVLARVALGEPAEEDEQRGVDDRVGVQHPGEVAEPVGAEVLRHVRERDVDDEEVEAGEDDPGADDDHDQGGGGVGAATAAETLA